MARPRVRFDDNGQALPCKVFIPAHLARFLYREAVKARRGEGPGLQIEETDIVIKLVEKWAESLPPMDWPQVLTELKAEEKAAAEANVNRKRGSGKPVPKAPEGEE